MLKRKAFKKLIEWKQQESKKALCIVGARQVGKTTLVRQFGQKYYQNFAEINFITNSRAKDIFESSLDANTIITNLTAFLQKPLEPGKTLILLDEIQECPKARTAIKFLVEDGRFDYIETGSLLGTKSNNVKSFPVGFEEIYRMYPMDFEEFLWANKVQDSTIEYLNACYKDLTPITKSIHETMNKLFYSYIVVGGMPAVVADYVTNHDIGRVIKDQRDILEQYRLDTTKYSNRNQQAKIKTIFDSIPSQLSEKNRRFYVNTLEPNARLLRFENCFKWLEDAGIALPCYNITQPVVPLQLNLKHSLFKLFMSDCGLLCAASMDNIQLDLLNGKVDVNMGSILENVIAQQLKSNEFNLYYYDSTKLGEVDFVVQNGSHIELLEVKSGADYKNHPALNRIMAVKEWKLDKATVLCRGNIEKIGNITYLPWYFIMFMRVNNIPQGMIYEVDTSSLNTKY